jgi:hypothetical protein
MPGFEDWSGRTFRNINLNNTVWNEADLVGARFSGRVDGLVINGVEVAPLIEAELDRRYPVRLQLRPSSNAEARGSWEVIESLWAASKARAASVDASLLDARLEADEYSWSDNFRHLVFVTDAWVSKNGLGVDDWHPLGVPPSFLPWPPGADPSATPTWPEVVEAREGRMALVRAHLDTLPMRIVRVVLGEEWAHDWYANRDLDQLSSTWSRG